MRICLVITELEPGGAERALVHLACGLEDRNIDVLVVSLKPLPSSPRDELVHHLEEKGIALTSLNIHNVFGFLRARARLRSLINDYQPDIVQSFLHHANILCAMCHRDKDAWKMVAGYRVADPSRGRAFLEKRYRRYWDHFSCVSRDVADELLARLHLDERIVTTIPNGVDIDRFKDAQPLSESQLATDGGRKLLGIIGRLHPQKGLEEFLPHVPDLLATLPGHDLVIAGDGPLREKLQADLAQFDLEDRVSLAGWIPDIPGLLASIDVLLLPSLWEGMPNVILEAMAAGIPVVSFRVHGITELLGEAHLTQVVEPGDYSGFCRKVTALASSPATALELGHANAKQIAGFSIANMVDRYNQLYQALCE